MEDYWTKNNIIKPQSIIVCAATIFVLNNCNEVMLVGPRHHDSVMNRQAELMKLEEYSSKRQGFIDQFGDFYDRVQALAVVKASGQPFNQERNKSFTELFSEGLY